MRKAAFLLFFLSLWIGKSHAQSDVFEKLKERYRIPQGLSTDIKITVSIPGISVPEKTAKVEYEVGKPPKITGPGLLFFPKKGLFEEFQNILNESSHSILIEETTDSDWYKLVSLNPKSDWVTADLKVFRSDPRIDELILTTRSHGEFHIFHQYGQVAYPIQSDIHFESDRFSIPLKFLGKGEPIPKELEGEKIQGKIVLTYQNLKIY